MTDIGTLLEGLGGAAAAISSSYAGVRHMVKRSKAKKAEARAAILAEANAEMLKIRAELEDKIRNLEVELENQKINLSKDLSHLREIYNAEIKVLGEKIDTLRADLADQHTSMVALLTRLVESR